MKGQEVHKASCEHHREVQLRNEENREVYEKETPELLLTG